MSLEDNIDKGRELAAEMMSDLVAKSRNEEEMNNKVSQIHVAASTILATIALNWVEFDGDTSEEALEEVFEGIEHEYEWILEQGVEAVYPGDNKGVLQ